MSDFGFDNYHGGGFNNTSQGGFTTEHAGSSQRQTATQVRQSLTPVTIKQINDATQPVPDAEFKVNNVELNMISFVGVVRKVENMNASISVTIEDGTGSIDVRKWVDEAISTADEECQKYSELKDKYVFVGGSLKQFSNRKTVQNASISPITDSNQIVYHHLSAIEHHLKAQGISTTGAGGQTTNATTSAGSGLFVDNPTTHSKGTGSMTDQVFAVLKESSNTMQAGVPVDYIIEKLNITKEECLLHVGKLLEEGKVFAGYDDNAYVCL
ncbi:replication factor A protein 2, putative [Candida dubliniensis CD36]|uniref:Replication factor A protein 2, putative n=1 Tax=Candida dubliniensis (strain CD36 / ATCC MYA-646 / CBS 7987 / NCPF 3949 / NRRL Y-17841) TaxID=573826 RepID=B9WBZ9_CANDC|nr:replication factor A protein 2, putative [Candida dubliniensis CD36]CAX43921.1 replication factor A protein 2, putative [Candida dubliniensis CD36]